MSHLKYLDSDYIPKGEIEGFPLEIIDRMIDGQVKQGNPADVKVFERLKNAHRRNGGFSWAYSDEGYDFWNNVLSDKNFNLFFEKYTEEELSPKELPLPRVIEVRDSEIDVWEKRVVFAFKKNKAICWLFAETLEEAEDEVRTAIWNYWREVEDGLQEEELDEGR